MYAIVRTGGKQYRVQPGDVIRVEKLEQALGAEFDLTDVLMVGGATPVVGQPVVKGAAVTVVVTKQTKDRKVIVFKKKRRQGYRRFKTHRQPYTELFVKSIAHGGNVAKTEETAQVVDVPQQRIERIENKVAARKARAAAPKAEKAEAAPKKAAAKKKVAKKAAPAKKKATAKKATGAKKKTAKKAKAKK